MKRILIQEGAGRRQQRAIRQAVIDSLTHAATDILGDNYGYRQVRKVVAAAAGMKVVDLSTLGIVAESDFVCVEAQPFEVAVAAAKTDEERIHLQRGVVE